MKKKTHKNYEKSSLWTNVKIKVRSYPNSFCTQCKPKINKLNNSLNENNTMGDKKDTELCSYHTKIWTLEKR